MDLYVIYQVDEGYGGWPDVAGIFFNESNARKELENLKERLMAIRSDSRFKKWWSEEPLDPYTPDTITKFRLFDEALKVGYESKTDIVLEIRVLQSGDEPDGYFRRPRDSKEKAEAVKKSPKIKED